MKKFKKLLAGFMTLAMLVTMLPATVLANDPTWVTVTTTEQLADELKRDAENIYIKLGKNVSLKGECYNEWGSASTQTITINGDGNTLTFEDSYRTYIKTAGAKLVLNNVDIVRDTTNTNTHWHDNNMMFWCNVEMNDVTFDKGITITNQSTAVLNQVTINKSNVGTYALFIQDGCDVTLKDCKINATVSDSRAIKITDEDHKDNAELTKLSISGTTFVSKNKAAVLVSSTGGAEITWGTGNDISDVAKDSVNPVWVDEDRADYASLVKVTGGSKVVEGAVAEVNGVYFASLEEAVDAAADGDTIILLADAGFVNTSKTLTFKGATGKEKLTLGNAYGTYSAGMTFEDLTMIWTNANYKGLQHIGKETYINCVIEGQPFLYGEESVFEKCTFNQTSADAYNVWTYGSKDVTFTECTFNSAGKAVLVYNEGATDSDVTFNKCTFTATQSSDKAAIEIDSTYSDFNVTITDCTASGFADTVTGHDLDETKQVKSNVWHEKENKYVPTKVTDIVAEGDKTTVYTKSDAHGEHAVTVNETTTPEPTPSTSSSKSSSKKYNVEIEDTDDGTVKASSTRVKKGATVTLTVTPDDGYELDEIIVLDKDGDEVDVTDKGNGKFTFTMPKGGVTVETTFEEAEDEKEPVVEETDKDASAGEVEEIILTVGQKIAWVFDEYVVNDVAPVIRNDRTMLPIRFVAEALGATVTWDEPTQTVTIVKGDLDIEIYIGQAFAKVNGTPVQLDSPAFIENDRTYLPLRFVAENLGATVTWDADTQKVTIIPGE